MAKQLTGSDAKDLSYPIPIGRRIKEILLDRKITPNSFYKKVGMGRGTFYDCIDGKRHISPSELRLIAENLNLPVDRIKQEDTRTKAIELRSLVQKSSVSKRAVKLGLELLPTAIGLSEKFDILNDLGGAYQLLKQYPEAHQTWQEAYSYAEKLYKLFDDKDRLYKVVNNLVISFTIRKDFSSIYSFLDQVGIVFDQQEPTYSGTLSYSQAIAALEMGNKDEYRNKIYDSLWFYQLTDNPRLIGTALHNAANAEFIFGNYLESKKLLILACSKLSVFPDLKYICFKTYTKTLLALGEKTEAIELIQRCLDELEGVIEKQYEEITAKFLILHSYSTGSIDGAETVLANKGLDRSIYTMACKLVMDYYCKFGDSENLMKYYKIAGQYNLSSSSSFWRGL